MSNQTNIEIKNDQDFWSGAGKGLNINNVEVSNLILSKDLLTGLMSLSSNLNLVIDYALGYRVTIRATYEVFKELGAEQTAGLNEKQLAKLIIDNTGVFLSPTEESLTLDNSHDISYPESLKKVFEEFFINSDFTFHFTKNQHRFIAWSVGDEDDDFKPVEWISLYLDALSTPVSKADDECKPCISDDDHAKIQQSIKNALKSNL